MQNNILEQFFEERNLSPKTIKQYKTSWKQYCEFHSMTVGELLEEADREEEDGIRMKRRSLKTRLTSFRTYLIESGNSKNSIVNKMNQIKALYRHFEIELPNLPYLNDKQLKKSVPLTYDDLPTKTIIREAMSFGTQLVRSFIILQVSSGMAKAEVLSLSVGQFLDACDVLDENKSIREMLVGLYRSDELIVPTFKLKRQKVNEYYYTFCTAECVMEITRMLLNERRELTLDSPLFKIGENYINQLYGEINDVLGLGKDENGYNRFRTHILRKFNATALTTGENAMSEADVDFLQGRSRGKIRETYMKKDPSLLKHRYIKAMNNVLINHESSVVNQQIRELELNEDKLSKIIELLNKFDIDLEAL